MRQHISAIFFSLKKNGMNRNIKRGGFFSIAVIREVEIFFFTFTGTCTCSKIPQVLLDRALPSTLFPIFFFNCIFFIFYLFIIINVPLYISQVENNRNFTLVFPYIYMRCSVLSTSTYFL